MATIMKMPVEVVEGGRLVVVSSKVSSNCLLTTSLIATSDAWYHSQWLSAFLFNAPPNIAITSPSSHRQRKWCGRGLRGLPFMTPPT